jgi:hypothetical protein
MGKVLLVIRRKPRLFFFIIGTYLLLTVFSRWKLDLKPEIFFYLAGGIIGTFVLDLAEEFFQLHPSPFRSVLFIFAFIPVSFFIVTSSGSFFASGIVMAIHLTLLIWQAGELRIRGNLESWYRLIAALPPIMNQRLVLAGQAVLLLVLAIIFSRS